LWGRVCAGTTGPAAHTAAPSACAHRSSPHFVPGSAATRGRARTGALRTVCRQPRTDGRGEWSGAMSILASLDQKLAQLKLSRLRAVVASWIAQAEQQQLGYAEFLDELLAEEVLGRQENQIRRKLTAAGFPYAATVEQFDWSVRPELKR